jgi:hypothetical protein
MGGLLPYRARKVRYFLDPRFKGRGGRPPPDKPEEQARELLARVPSDWDGLVALRAIDAGPSLPTASQAGPAMAEVIAEDGSLASAALVGAAAASWPPEATAGVVEDVWREFFPAEPEGTSTADACESTESPSTTTKELPV